jgi:3-deoxy-D-arabino-heptulosonate 7-phosphate (DAHP) synthase class II
MTRPTLDSATDPADPRPTHRCSSPARTSASVAPHEAVVHAQHVFLANDPECLGGPSGAVLEEQLSHRYETLCDPRLIARRSLDLAFRVAEPMRPA